VFSWLVHIIQTILAYLVLEGGTEGTVRLPQGLLDHAPNAADGLDAGALEAGDLQCAVEHALNQSVVLWERYWEGI